MGNKRVYETFDAALARFAHGHCVSAPKRDPTRKGDNLLKLNSNMSRWSGPDRRLLEPHRFLNSLDKSIC
jgi:hypothetical protein